MPCVIEPHGCLAPPGYTRASVRNKMGDIYLAEFDNAYDAFSQYVERKQIIDEEENGFGRIVVYWDTSDEPNTGTVLSSKFGFISALCLLAICKMIMQ